MKLPILTRRLFIRHAFRENCIFTDYDYNKSFDLRGNLKLSIDIFIMSVRLVFAELRVFKTRQKAHHVCVLYFIKAQCFVDIVSAHIYK